MTTWSFQPGSCRYICLQYVRLSQRAGLTKDVLRSSITVLETLQKVSNVVAAIPCFGVVLSASLALLKTIEAVNGTHDRSKRLAQRAVDLVQQVERTVTMDLDAVEDDMMDTFSSLLQCVQPGYVRHSKLFLSSRYRTIHDIRDAISRQGNHNFFARLLKHASILDALDDHVETLDKAWRSFDTSCLI